MPHVFFERRPKSSFCGVNHARSMLAAALLANGDIEDAKALYGHLRMPRPIAVERDFQGSLPADGMLAYKFRSGGIIVPAPCVGCVVKVIPGRRVPAAAWVQRQAC